MEENNRDHCSAIIVVEKAAFADTLMSLPFFSEVSHRESEIEREVGDLSPHIALCFMRQNQSTLLIHSRLARIFRFLR